MVQAQMGHRQNYFTYFRCAATGMLQPHNSLTALAFIKLNMTVDTCVKREFLNAKMQWQGLRSCVIHGWPRNGFTIFCVQVMYLRAGCD